MFVTVCACTYRRPQGLRALLDGLARQRFRATRAPQLALVIADNEGSAEAERACAAFRSASPLALRYVREPRRGIPWARNACLDHVPPESDFFAMIDDDEVPEPDWLDELLRAQAASGADVVQGAVVPRFPEAAPAWMREGSFFGWPNQRLVEKSEAPVDGQALGSAATNNVLVRCAAVRKLDLRFDTRVGLRGWDDALFFRALARGGARIVYAARARVVEIVPPERATLRYLLRVEYRQGQKKLPIKLLFHEPPAGAGERARLRAKTALRGVAALASGVWWIARSVLAGARRPRRFAIGVLRLANGTGMLASVFGARYEHYR